MNLRHLAPKASALPDCATPRRTNYAIHGKWPLRGPPCVAGMAHRADNRACRCCAAVAQWIEHRPSKPAVGGSIPSCRAPCAIATLPASFDARGAQPLSFTSPTANLAPRKAESIKGFAGSGRSTVAVAQLVESRIVIPVVVGSSPISHPIDSVCTDRRHR